MVSANLYEVLGLSREASAKDIENAYQRRKDRYQSNPAALGGEEGMAQIEDAYAILSDPDRRADYDGDMAAATQDIADEGGGAPIETIHCQVCDAMPVQPRYLVFWRVLSLLLITNRTPVQGVYCSSCAGKEAWTSTAFTSFLGWWGIPWGPIWTIGKGFQNVAGGEQPAGVSEALGWQNVIAFSHLGETASAYAGAQHLLKGRDPAIMAAAQEYIDACHADGFAPQPPPADAWKGNPVHTIGRALLLLILPLIIVALIATSDGSSSYADSGDDLYYADTLPPVSTVEVEAPEPVATCEATPANGAVLAGAENLLADGHQVEIDNGASGNAIVNVRNNATNALVASFYVARGETASVDGLPDGTYKLQYALGGPLDEACRMFAGEFSANAFPDAETFSAQYVNDERGEGYIYQVLSYTLYSVAGGTVQPEYLADDAFTAD